jgi:hypothetical protein
LKYRKKIESLRLVFVRNDLEDINKLLKEASELTMCRDGYLMNLNEDSCIGRGDDVDELAVS